MTDLRDYAKVIRSTIKECSKADKDYRWNVISITKNEAKFRWSYLSAGDPPFVLYACVSAVDGTEYVTVDIPYYGKIIALIGDDFYDDARTMADAIVYAIKGAVSRAQHTF